MLYLIAFSYFAIAFSLLLVMARVMADSTKLQTTTQIVKRDH